MRHSIILLSLIFILAGCNTQQSVPVAQVTSTQFANSATVSGTSDFDSNLRVQGAWVGGSTNRYLLRGSIGKTSKNITVLQLYIQLYYNSKDWIFYETAQDESAQSIDLTVIRQDVESCGGSLGYCSYYEDVGVGLTLEYLLEKQNTGFKVRILGKGGNSPRIYEVPANYLQGFLQALKNNGAIELENFAEASDTGSAASQVQPAQVVSAIQSEASDTVSAVSQEQPAQAVSTAQSEASNAGSAIPQELICTGPNIVEPLKLKITRRQEINFDLKSAEDFLKCGQKYKVTFDIDGSTFSLDATNMTKGQETWRLKLLPNGALIGRACRLSVRLQCDKTREQFLEIYSKNGG